MKGYLRGMKVETLQPFLANYERLNFQESNELVIDWRDCSSHVSLQRRLLPAQGCFCQPHMWSLHQRISKS